MTNILTKLLLKIWLINKEKKQYLDWFFLHTNSYKLNNIIFIRSIHNGYTNKSFFIKTDDNKSYQLRIAHNNNIVDRKSEFNVLRAINDKNYLYYDETNGNAIKKWINGQPLSKLKSINYSIIDNLIHKINDLHNIDFNNYKIRVHDYYNFIQKSDLEQKYLDKYYKIVNNFDSSKYVLSHNDLNLDNILINAKNELIFIDYEWSRINHWLWDISNFIKEANLDIKYIDYIAQKLNISSNELIEFVYVSICYSYQWTFYTSYSNKVKKYRKLMTKMLEKYYVLVK